MNTADPAARDRELCDHGYFTPPAASNPPSPASCRLAATGVCPVRDLCRHAKSEAGDAFRSGSVNRRLVHRGQTLYRAGDTFANLYPLYGGLLKMRVTNCAGEEQITSFPMPGTLLGLDGIEAGKYTCDAVALEDTLVCILPFSDLMACSRAGAQATLQLSRAIAQEAGRYRRMLTVLATMDSEARLASFLLDLSRQMAANGYSSREFVLKMTREDIAHHLGMRIETVSRAFTRLQMAHIVDVRRRNLSIRDLDALKRLGTGS